jgi:Cft2 family RNA processing exonuclease
LTRHVAWDRGVALVECDLWLDPLTVRERAFVSHAHADHVRRHRLALMTPDTLALLPPNRRPRQARLLGLGETDELGAATVALHDAGHMLGSAQLLVELEGHRLLYTGDLRLRRPGGGPEVEVPRADVLVIESTYGRPGFRFPDPDTVVGEIASWCRRLLERGVTPVLLAHALGKTQELMRALAPHGLRFALDPRCVPFTRAYEAAGLELPSWEELDGRELTAARPQRAGNVLEGRVVLAPPAGKGTVRRLGRRRVALVSGWAQDPRFWRMFGADCAFPLSDHCDFLDLLAVVERSGAGKVYTVHGFAEEFARQLRRRGIEAHALHLSEQLRLSL